MEYDELEAAYKQAKFGDKEPDIVGFYSMGAYYSMLRERGH